MPSSKEKETSIEKRKRFSWVFFVHLFLCGIHNVYDDRSVINLYIVHTHCAHCLKIEREREREKELESIPLDHHIHNIKLLAKSNCCFCCNGIRWILFNSVEIFLDENGFFRSRTIRKIQLKILFAEKWFWDAHLHCSVAI